MVVSTRDQSEGANTFSRPCGMAPGDLIGLLFFALWAPGPHLPLCSFPVGPCTCCTHCLQHPPLSSSSGSCSASDASLITTSLEQSSRLCCFDQVLSSASPHALFCLYKLACECVFGVYLLPDSRLRRGGTTISPAPKGEGIPEMVGR